MNRIVFCCFASALLPTLAHAKSLALPYPLDATPVFADEPFRATQPPPGPVKQVASPKPVVFALANGIAVVLVERHQLPTVSLQLELPGGGALDPVGKEGRASVCTQLWGDGTAKLDKLQLAEALADLGSSVGASAATEDTTFELATLSRNLFPTLNLFADVLLQPGLRADELGRIVARRKAALVAAKGNPSQLAGRLFASVAYGPAHPRGRTVTEASLQSLTIDDCKAWASGHGSVGATLYIVGDMSRAQVEAELGGRMALLPAKGYPVAAFGPPQPAPGKLFVAEVAGAEQSVVVVLHPGPARQAADFDASAVMTSILSSGFSSRINQNIREKKGWAYGAGGNFGYTKEGSVLAIQAAVRADATGPSVAEILREMAEMRTAPPTAEELEREKQGAMLSLPARWATGRSILGTFQSLRYYGLPLDDFDRYVARVQTVDAQAVQAAATAHVQPGSAQVLIVGDPAKIKVQIEALLADGPLKGAVVVRLDGDGKRL